MSGDLRYPLALLAAALVASTGCTRAVQVYVTTGDRARLLSREADVSLEASAAVTAVIEVDTTKVYQEMVGFGASLTDASAWLIQHKLTAAQREALLQDLFGPPPGAGFSFIRVDMGASDFSRSHYSYNDLPAGRIDPEITAFSIAADQAETIPILKRALVINPQLTVMASPWSAPAWMKTTGSMIKGTLKPEAYAAFALYFKRFIEAYAAEGIPMWAITVQNEPHFEPDNYPGMRLDPAQRARFSGQFLGPLLERSGIRTRILDWDHNWDEPNSPLQVLADTAARRYIAGVAWHCYGGDVAAQSTVHEAYPDKDAFFTECSGGAWAPNFADNLVWTTGNLIIGSVRHWSRGVLMWNLALDENHGPHLGGCGNCRGVVTINSASGEVTRNEEYYAFAHASRFVRPGARRIASSSGVQGLESVAFRNVDGSIVLLVLNTNAMPAEFGVRAHGRGFRHTLSGRTVATYLWK